MVRSDVAAESEQTEDRSLRVPDLRASTVVSWLLVWSWFLGPAVTLGIVVWTGCYWLPIVLLTTELAPLTESAWAVTHAVGAFTLPAVLAGLWIRRTRIEAAFLFAYWGAVGLIVFTGSDQPPPWMTIVVGFCTGALPFLVGIRLLRWASRRPLGRGGPV